VSVRALGAYDPGPVDTVLLIDGPGTGVDPDALHCFRQAWERTLQVALTYKSCATEAELYSTLANVGSSADAVVLNPGTAGTGDLPRPPMPCARVTFAGKAGYIGTGVHDDRPDEIAGRGIDGYRWAIRHLIARGAWGVSMYAYADHAHAVGDLRIPTGAGPHPVVMTIHGGGWKHRWQRDLMEPLAVDLARRGFASWNIEFRRVGGGGGWPATFDDIAAAVDALADLADATDLDLARVCFLGHSAGGHLALWAAARRSQIHPALVVSIAGIPDLAEAARRELIGGDNIAARLLGGGPDDVPDRYGKASPIELVPIGCRQLLIQGLADYIADLIDLNRSYARMAIAAGDFVELVELEGVEHLEPIEPGTHAWQLVATEIEARV
jgi:acetyl esterase/lipase